MLKENAKVVEDQIKDRNSELLKVQQELDASRRDVRRVKSGCNHRKAVSPSWRKKATPNKVR